MYAILIYMAAAGALMLGAQAVRPSQALGDDHHRRLYWGGALASIGLVGIIAGVLVI
ncbi:MAG: hypothetical protein J0I45_08875 [Bosea sp.]|nr:hypothetical protein [Bosea sp. (in: a-proteobacteria)]